MLKVPCILYFSLIQVSSWSSWPSQFHNGSLIVIYMIEGYRKRGHFLLLVELWKAFELPHVSAKYTRVVFFVIVDYIDQPFGWPPVEILLLAFYTHLFSSLLLFLGILFAQWFCLEYQIKECMFSVMNGKADISFQYYLLNCILIFYHIGVFFFFFFLGCSTDVPMASSRGGDFCGRV